MYEGGTRVPFFALWLDRIKPGVSDALVCQVDFMASFAALTGGSLKPEAGVDSFNVLSALLGDSPKGRDVLVEQAQARAIRKGQWKLIPKTKNLATERPELVTERKALLEKIHTSGRSRI